MVRNDAGEVVFDANGQAKLIHADLDIRLARADQAPFPLYPGEILRQVKILKNLIEHNRKNLLSFSLSHP